MKGDRLAELRKDKKMTQEDLAKELNLSRFAVASYERGQSIPSEETLIKIAKMFDISLDYLFGLTDSQISFRRENAIDIPRKAPPEYITELLNYKDTLEYKYGMKKNNSR